MLFSLRPIIDWRLPLVENLSKMLEKFYVFQGNFYEIGASFDVVAWPYISQNVSFY